MGKFKIFVAGSNCLLTIDGEARKRGFFTTQFVEAGSPEGARERALELVRDELGDVLSNAINDPPVFEVEQTESAKPFEWAYAPGRGFAWYIEES